MAASATIDLLLQVALILGLGRSIDSLSVGLWFISIFLTTGGKDLAGIAIIIHVAIFAMIIISKSTITSSLIDSATASISYAASPIVSINIVATSTAAFATLAV